MPDLPSVKVDEVVPGLEWRIGEIAFDDGVPFVALSINDARFGWRHYPLQRKDLLVLKKALEEMER